MSEGYAEVAESVKERPILFSAPMIRCLLNGTKTQTRRVMKDQPSWCGDAVEFDNAPGWWAESDASDYRKCPYGVPGNRLWVRETWAMCPTACGGEETVYAADYPDGSDKAAGVIRRPSIHMRRDQSRITLEITDVRVQRLQEISEEDAKAEGVQPLPSSPPTRGHQRAFKALWHTIHAADGPHGWEANPWLWCITFRRVG